VNVLNFYSVEVFVQSKTRVMTAKRPSQFLGERARGEVLDRLI